MSKSLHPNASALATSKRGWAFLPRFRRNAFAWHSELPRKRLHEALTEIRQVAREDAIAAAEGAVLLIERLSPAFTRVDDSGGMLSSAIRGGLEWMVLLIAAAPVSGKDRERWLQRLWQALQDDEMPWIEALGDQWGTLCVDPAIASRWADTCLPTVRRIWHPDTPGHGFFTGTPVCLSSLYAAGRHEELLTLLESPRAERLWHYRQWGARALLALNRRAEALRYAEASRSS